MTYQSSVLVRTPVLKFLYADDSKIYKVIRNQSDQQKLQTTLNLTKKVV